MKRYDLELTATGQVMEERKEGAYVTFSEVEQLQAKVYALLEERNSTGIAISNAILSGIVPEQHPLRSRLELLANHHKREQALADGMVSMADRFKLLTDLLRDIHEYIGASIPQTISEHYRGCDLLDRIDAVLAGNLPERKITKPARVWGARFRPGIPEQTIIEAAYRYAEHESSQEEKEAGKINFDLLMAAVHKIAPEGWQLVPVEPTENMIGHGCGASVMVVSEVIKAWAAMLAAAPKPECCRPVAMTDMRFVVCPDCGNKRCPRANDHRNACTGSNELGQEGSAYPAAPKQQGGEPCASEPPSSSPA